MYLRQSYPASKPNSSFKPNLLRYSKSVAEKACHAFASTTQVGLTQALGATHRFLGAEMTLIKSPVARATMLIRRPVEEVFNAFVDPTVTTRFWFSRSSGQLAPGKTVTWYWDQYGVSGEVTVTALEKNQRIAIEWPTPVEWTFTPKGNDTTFVSIVASGFTGTDDEKVAQALDSTEGFNLVISACKALLEHGIDLRLISDKNPDAAVSGT